MKINTADLRLSISKTQMLSKVQQLENNKAFTNLYNEMVESKKSLDNMQKTVTKPKETYKIKLDNKSDKKNQNSNKKKRKKQKIKNKIESKTNAKIQHVGNKIDIRI